MKSPHKIFKTLISTTILLLTIAKNTLSQLLTEPPSDTGYHLFRDRTPVLARRLFQLPIEEVGRDLESPNGQLSYGTWQMSNGQKSFPEVRRVYSWAQEDDQSGRKFSMFKDNMGKYGFWQLDEGRQHLLEPNSIWNQNGGSFDLGRVRARIDALTGECSHKMHYRKPYLIIICYNQNAIHNTLNQPMVYDYYIRVADDDYWTIGGQNYMNSTASTNTPIGTAGKGTINVDFNHRVHVTTVRATRTNALIDGGTYESWWTLTWNGPYEGQMSSTGRFPNPSGPATSTDPGSVQFKSNNVIYLRPHLDIRYTKMCIVNLPNLRVITEIVQPDPASNNIIVIFAGMDNLHRIAKCQLDQTNLNLDPQIPPWGVSNTQCLQNCVLQTYNRGVQAGGIKYVPAPSGTDDFLVMVDQGAGKIVRCRWQRNLSGPEDQCEETPICPEISNRNAFGYFSDCRSTTSCGVYYMYGVGSGPSTLLNRVSCVDIVKFTGKPLSYRRHFTAIHAYDVANSVQSNTESEANSMTIRSYQELYIYNSIAGQPTKNQEIAYSYLARSHDREAVTSQDITVTGKVVRVQDPNSIEGVYPMTAYANHTYRLPFKRENWKGNALNVKIDGNDVNSSVLLLNDINMDNTDDVATRDQIPMGTESVRIRDNFGTKQDTVIELLRCTQKFNYTVDLNCTQFGSRRTINKESPTLHREVILRAWWFDNSIVLLTTDRTKANPSAVNRYRWSCYDKQNDKWSGTEMNAGEILEFYDVAEHNGDLIIAYKLHRTQWHPGRILTRRVQDLDCTTGWKTDFPDTPHITSNMNEHPAGNNGGRAYTTERYHPLEDDACHTGMNIVWDTSWKIRYLMDCNRKTLPTNNRWGNSKWIGDSYLVDNPNLGQYRTTWNISLRPDELSATDFLGDDFEVGCATSEYVIVTDTENPENDGWVMAAVHIRTHAVLFYDLDQFGISRIDNIMCIKDNVLVTGASDNNNRGFIGVLYGNNLDDARRRIHSIERFPFVINSITGTLVEDKIWIRFVANGRVYYRVAFMDGPIVLYNATNSHFAGSSYLETTNGFNDVKRTQTPVNFVWGNNEVNITDVERQKFANGNYDIERFSNIKGHVYTVTLEGIHANEMGIRQRVNKLNEVIRRSLQGPTPNGGRRYYEMRIKNDRMARLAWVDYFSEFSYYKDPNNRKYTDNLNIECQHLDFTTIPVNPISQIYFATVCQRVHYKEIRIYRENEENNNIDSKKRLVHNDDVHEISLDYVTTSRYLLGLYNKNHKLLNFSIYDFTSVTDTGFATSDIQAPIQTYIVQNVADWSVFHINGNTGIIYCLDNDGICRVRYAAGGTSGLFDNAIYTLNITTDLSRIYHVDCYNPLTSQSEVSCAIVGGDRRMFHYTFGAGGNTTINPTKKFLYHLYKDYEPMDVQIGSQYIIVKSESYDQKDKTVLVYKRQDVQDPGIGYLYGGVNGTVAGWDRWDWKNTKVQLAEYGGTHKIFLQHNEARNAEIYEIGPLRISLNNANWHNQKLNCIKFDGAENTKCVPVQDIWYRDIPNQPGPPEKEPKLKSDFWWKLLLWILAALILLLACLYILSLLRQSAKPGYKKIVGEKERKEVVYREEVYERGGSTRRDFVEREDEYLAQDQVYGDHAGYYGGGKVGNFLV